MSSLTPVCKESLCGHGWLWEKFALKVSLRATLKAVGRQQQQKKTLFIKRFLVFSLSLKPFMLSVLQILKAQLKKDIRRRFEVFDSVSFAVESFRIQ